MLYALSLTLLTFAFERLEVSVAYAVWSGAGLILIVAIGLWWFREPLTPIQLVCIGCILVGMIGLHLAAAPRAPGDAPLTRSRE